MSETQSLLEQLEKLLSWKKSKKFYAEKLGITEYEVEELLKELKSRDEIRNIEMYTEESSKKENFEKGTLESTIILDYEPKDHKELAKLHKVDLNTFTIVNYWSKLKSTGKFTSSIFCKRKKPEDYSLEDFSKFLKSYTPKEIPVIKLDKSNKDCVDVELSISDYHLAKKHIDDDNNNLLNRSEKYYNVAKELIEKIASVYDINTIAFPISNDFFHTDNYQNQTTNGTPQDVIASYDQEYETGFSLLINTISLLRKYSNNVVVVLVQGNHDRTKSFYLAHALEVFFSATADVSFLREHSTVKGLTLGNTFIGWHHGNCKIDELPLLFATHPKYSLEFGKAKYKEVHTGDKHHYMAKEIKGVRIQQMPSLSGTDRWHADNNYVHSIRAALALVYDNNVGKVSEFETRI